MTQIPENQQQYGSILTILGENAEQNGKLQNKQITFTHMAIGDANDEYVQPDRKQTALVNELARIPVNSVDVLQPTPDSVPMLKVEAILPDDVNDLVIREFAAVATFDGNTYFHAVGNCARIYVPQPVNNGNVSTPVTLEMIFVITSADPIVEIDPNIITASRGYVKDEEKKQTIMLSGHDDYISDVESGLIGKTFNGETAIQINNYPKPGKNSLFNLDPIPFVGSVIESIDFDSGKVFFTGGDESELRLKILGCDFNVSYGYLGYVVPPKTEALSILGTIYPLSKKISGEITSLNLMAKPYSADVGGKTVYLLDGRYVPKDKINDKTDVRAFWADGDYDPVSKIGVDATLCIQTALDNSLKSEFNSDCNFLISSKLVQPLNNEIVGKGTVTMKKGSIDTILESLNSGTNVSDLKFATENNDTSSQIVAELSGKYAVKLSGKKKTLEGCTFGRGFVYDVECVNAEKIKVKNTTHEIFEDQDGRVRGYGVVFDKAKHCSAIGVEIYGRNAGIVTLIGCEDISISRSSISRTYEVGIDLLACKRGEIYKNDIRYTGLTGIRLGLETTEYPTYYVSFVSVEGNNLLNCGTRGAYAISADVSGDTADDPKQTGYHTIFSNTITYEYSSTQRYGRAIQCNTSNTSILSNDIYGGGVLRFGIDCSGRTRNNTIDDNTVYSTLEQGISVILSSTNRQCGYKITNNTLIDVGTDGSTDTAAMELWYVKGSKVTGNDMYCHPNTNRGLSMPTGCTGSTVDGNNVYSYNGYPMTAEKAFYATDLATSSKIRWGSNFVDNIDVNNATDDGNLFFNDGETEKTVSINFNYKPTVQVSAVLSYGEIFIKDRTESLLTFGRTLGSGVQYFTFNAKMIMN